MKTSALVWTVIVLAVIAGGLFWWVSMQPATSITTVPPVTAVPTPQIAQVGEHCGGNIVNAPICVAGTHCAADANSQLPVGDVGGTCVTDNSAEYVEGNLLLGTDSTTTLGTYLIGYNGMTVYSFANDKGGISNCAGQCTLTWPPYVVAATSSLANIQAGIGGIVGSITRADGSFQVTYKGEPLYFYSKDIQSGDTLGNKVGGLWFVVKP